MRRLIALLLFIATAVFGGAAVAHAAPPAPSGTIALNEAGPFAINDTVTFTTTTANIKGSRWPMVYVVCYADDDPGLLLYGMLDHPDVGFLLGGGWSPWRDAENVGKNATCVGQLLVYSKHGDVTFLAQTAAFDVSGTAALSVVAQRSLRSTLVIADTTFNESTTAYTSARAPGNRDLYVYVRCWIAGSIEYVYSEFDLVVSGTALIQNHPSPGTPWWLSPGPGDCTATAGYFRGTPFNLAAYTPTTDEVSFHVAA